MVFIPLAVFTLWMGIQPNHFKGIVTPTMEAIVQTHMARMNPKPASALPVAAPEASEDTKVDAKPEPKKPVKKTGSHE
jgi:hypothetical protein